MKDSDKDFKDVVFIWSLITLLMVSILGLCEWMRRETNDYSKYKDFDISKMELSIAKLNGGDYTLVKDGEKFTWRGLNYVSEDTCKLKYEVYVIWKDEIRK